MNKRRIWIRNKLSRKRELNRLPDISSKWLLRWGNIEYLVFLQLFVTMMQGMMRGIKSPVSWALIPRNSHLISHNLIRVLEPLSSVCFFGWRYLEIEFIFVLSSLPQFKWWFQISLYCTTTVRGNLRRDGWWWSLT